MKYLIVALVLAVGALGASGCVFQKGGPKPGPEVTDEGVAPTAPTTPTSPTAESPTEPEGGEVILPPEGTPPPPCVPETDAEFCGLLGKDCGEVAGTDNCGAPRTALCGTCTGGLTCGGGGVLNVCGGIGTPPCVAETNAEFCRRLNRTCGMWTGPDNCGATRTVADCGTCGTGTSCVARPTESSCIAPTPPVYRFLYVSVDKATNRGELYQRSTATDSVSERLTNINAGETSRWSGGLFGPPASGPSFPSVSPDGRTVLFSNTADHGKLWQVIRIDGAPVAGPWGDSQGYYSSTFPAAQDAVVFVSGGCGLIRKAARDGSGAADEIPASGDNTYHGVTASPVTDSSHFSYNKFVYALDTDASDPARPDLWYKILGGGSAPLTRTRDSAESEPAFSPDGQHLAYVKDEHIARCNLAESWFLVPIMICTDEFVFDVVGSSPCWSSDGQRIFFSRKTEGSLSNYDIFSIKADGTEPVMQNHTNSPGTDDVQPACFH